MNYHFTTERLKVKEWHSFEEKELHEPDLANIVAEMLEPEVTKRFPIMWRGDYDKKRAKFWIQERDSESKTLLAVEKKTKKPLGYINFFKEVDKKKGVSLRLGYLVSKVMWNNGLATELVEGFIRWCKENNTSPVVARVDPDNIASIRVLEKNNFLTHRTDANGAGLLFAYDFGK